MRTTSRAGGTWRPSRRSTSHPAAASLRGAGSAAEGGPWIAHTPNQKHPHAATTSTSCAVPPAQRFRQHKEGYRSSRHVRKHGKHLRPGLYRRFNPMATREEAVAMERELARRLRNLGYTVYGGH